MSIPPEAFERSHYAGRYVAVIEGRVIGQGGTPEQALQAAKTSRHKEIPEVVYVPTSNPLVFSPILTQVCKCLPQGLQVYLVGGAVRDAIRSIDIHDYDFVVVGNALQVAREVADRVGGAYFPLDQERNTGRVILSESQEARTVLDFVSIRGQSLESDLSGRDFTINAMAVDVRKPQELLDPTGGLTDLWNKILRSCSPSSFVSDPVRILRAIRLAANMGLKIHPESRVKMREAVHLLESVSAERLRDEIFRIFDGPRPETSIRALDMLGALPYILPELLELKVVKQSPPHIKDVWGHTLDTLKNLGMLLDLISQRHQPDDSLGLILGLAVIRLGRYRKEINEHIKTEIIQDRTVRSLMCLASLYHDIAKPASMAVDDSGQIRFIGHDLRGGEVVSLRGETLHLSNKEIERLGIIVRNHMRPTLLARERGNPSGRAIYRFFRDTQAAGIDIGLISLADLLATYGTTLPQERWARQLDIVRALMDAWWEQPEKQVKPPVLVTGDDLKTEFGLEEGPQIGEILEMVREAQVSGEVATREEALDLVRTHFENQNHTEPGV